jgi:methionine-S-sulfoxide reductase
MLDGVKSVESGFSGGKVANPSYREVCMGTTGHAEVVQIVYDNKKTSLDEILKVFFTVHDPTTLNRQGADVGEQYRSVILYRNAAQQKTATDIINQLNKEKVYDEPVVTAVQPFKVFYKAEDDHQDYYNANKSNGYCKMVIQPKIEKFEKLLPINKMADPYRYKPYMTLSEVKEHISGLHFHVLSGHKHHKEVLQNWEEEFKRLYKLVISQQ